MHRVEAARALPSEGTRDLSPYTGPWCFKSNFLKFDKSIGKISTFGNTKSNIIGPIMKYISILYQFDNINIGIF